MAAGWRPFYLCSSPPTRTALGDAQVLGKSKSVKYLISDGRPCSYSQPNNLTNGSCIGELKS